MTRRLAPLALLSAAALLGAQAPASAIDAKEFKKQFVATPNSWERRALVGKLDPADKKSRKLLVDFVLKKQDWYMREAAIDILAGVYDPGLIAELEKAARKDKKAVVAEGVTMAWGRSKNPERVPFIIEMLENKKWTVRRAAALALRKIPHKDAVGPLITAWENEDRFLVWVHILETLERITRQKNMPTPQDWKDWWSVAQDNFEVNKNAEDELSEEEKSGDLIKTRVRGTNITARARGKGLPLLVLPDYGYEQDYLETYLRNLEDTSQIIYLRLPAMYDFVDPPEQNAPGLPMPYWPVERVTDAFEELQRNLEKEGKIKGKFAILAHGMSCWAAMSFAIRHPRAVRRMILIAADSSNKSNLEGTERLERYGQSTGDIEMEHYAQNCIYNSQKGAPNYEPKSGEEALALTRKGFTLRFADTRDLEIGRIFGKVVEKEAGGSKVPVPEFRRPMGGCFVPQFSLFKLDRVPTPTLVIHGAHSVRISMDDSNAIAKHYGANASVVTFKRSSEMPFIEENDRFVEVMRRFLGGKKKK